MANPTESTQTEINAPQEILDRKVVEEEELIIEEQEAFLQADLQET